MPLTRCVLAAAVLAVLPAAAGAQAVEATVIDYVAYPRFDYVAPGYDDSTQGHWHNLTGSTLGLRLPDGRMAIVNCKRSSPWMSYWVNWQYMRFCPSPAVNVQVNVVLAAQKAKLSWIGDDSKPVKQTYRVLAVLDPPAK